MVTFFRKVDSILKFIGNTLFDLYELATRAYQHYDQPIRIEEGQLTSTGFSPPEDGFLIIDCNPQGSSATSYFYIQDETTSTYVCTLYTNTGARCSASIPIRGAASYKAIASNNWASVKVLYVKLVGGL